MTSHLVPIFTEKIALSLIWSEVAQYLKRLFTSLKTCLDWQYERALYCILLHLYLDIVFMLFEFEYPIVISYHSFLLLFLNRTSSSWWWLWPRTCKNSTHLSSLVLIETTAVCKEQKVGIGRGKKVRTLAIKLINMLLYNAK